MSEIQDKLAEQGFVFIENFEEGKCTSEITERIGETLQLGLSGPVHQLVPKEATESTPNTYSGNYGLGEFPMHTDFAHWRVPPRYFVLRCVCGDPSVRTHLIDGWSLISSNNNITFSRALVRSRRPVNGSYQMLRLLENYGASGQLIRWDEKYIEPISDAGHFGFNKLKELIDASERNEVCLNNPSDMVLIDNWRIIHGRSSVENKTSQRIIDRAYFGNIKL